MAGGVTADDASRLPHLLRWSGVALVAAGVLMVVATLLHPSRETAATIVASEPRLVAVLVALGAPAHLLGFGIAQLVTTAAWPIAILGSACLGAGLGWAG
jgi:hypothetical protein